VIRKKPGPIARYRAKRKRAKGKVVKVVRPQLVHRANAACERCGEFCGDFGHAHHRIPRSRGGQWTLDNMEYLCAECHQLAHLENAL
jgi:5-methylcytosine-specific restriction endonuclease McrA